MKRAGNYYRVGGTQSAGEGEDMDPLRDNRGVFLSAVSSISIIRMHCNILPSVFILDGEASRGQGCMKDARQESAVSLTKDR